MTVGRGRVSETRSIDQVLERPVMGAYRWNIYIICGLLMALEGYDAYVVSNLAPVGKRLPVRPTGKDRHWKRAGKPDQILASWNRGK